MPLEYNCASLSRLNFTKSIDSSIELNKLIFGDKRIRLKLFLIFQKKYTLQIRVSNKLLAGLNMRGFLFKQFNVSRFQKIICHKKISINVQPP